MNFLKTMSIKTRFVIFHIIMTLSGICAAVKIILDFMTDQELPIMTWALILAFVFVTTGFIFRSRMVKCPFCGDKLKDLQKAPDVCPTCRRSAYLAFDPAALEEAEDA